MKSQSSHFKFLFERLRLVSAFLVVSIALCGESRAKDWNASKLDDWVRYCGEHRSSSVLALQNGVLIREANWEPKIYSEGDPRFERLSHGVDKDGYSREDVASIQKSIAALIVGMAQERGHLSVDDPVHKHLGEGWSRAAPEKESAITLKHLLSMASGLDDALRYEVPAGERWRYNTTAYGHAMHVVSAATKMPASEVVEKWLVEPMGLMDSEWTYREGLERANIKNTNVFGWITTCRDLARIGQLLLDEGQWKGSAVIKDKDYLREMARSSQDMNPSYGYLWWLNGKKIVRRGEGNVEIPGPMIPTAPNDLYAAKGLLNRSLFIVPSMNLVVARIGNAPKSREFDTEFWRLLMAAAP